MERLIGGKTLADELTNRVRLMQAQAALDDMEVLMLQREDRESFLSRLRWNLGESMLKELLKDSTIISSLEETKDLTILKMQLCVIRADDMKRLIEILDRYTPGVFR